MKTQVFPGVFFTSRPGALDELFKDVEAFLEKFCDRAPGEVLGARRKMVAEEAREYDEALESGDRVRIAHEGIDLIYSTIGGLVEAGISPEQALRVWAEVARANAASAADGFDVRSAVRPASHAASNRSRSRSRRSGARVSC